MKAKTTRDNLRRIAIASQAIGLIALFSLETWLRDNARPWQGLVFILMLISASVIALIRRYQRNQLAKKTRNKLS